MAEALALRVLIIEDDAQQRESLLEYLSTCSAEFEVEQADALEEAEELLASQDFDLIVIDLHIPDRAGSADRSYDYGKRAYQAALTHQPGTPRRYFSAFISLENIGDDLALSQPDDLYGDKVERPITLAIDKKDGYEPCEKALMEIWDASSELGAIRIDGPSTGSPLDVLERRAVSIFARRHGGTSLGVTHLGGLSGSRAIEIQVLDSQDRPLARAFGKIGGHPALAAERLQFKSFVENRLTLGTYADLTNEVRCLIGRRLALFYSLADEFDRSLFEVVDESDEEAVAVLDRLKAVVSPWIETADVKSFDTAEFRRQRIRDHEFDDFAGRYDLEHAQATVERRQIDTRVAVQHGDLHAENVRVDRTGKPLLIDFGDVGPAPVGLDPLCLELSLVFHPDSPVRAGSWPTLDQLAAWFDLDSYLLDCPAPDFVRACREWLSDVADGPTQAALLWGHTARQVKYKVVDDRALAALLSSAAAALT